ncbi:hypothetical protein MRX96_016534 [Rhipicephalus microplus]
MRASTYALNNVTAQSVEKESTEEEGIATPTQRPKTGFPREPDCTAPPNGRPARHRRQRRAPSHPARSYCNEFPAFGQGSGGALFGNARPTTSRNAKSPTDQ